ncbi:hypothetical protein [Coprococcus comes]|uniref:hypothetical protein n=1 Tax=Coprococcus comes TaxID=410072 RepID=UPI00189ABD5A|nr:hypothetical protein [Coprococcus comes]
MSLRMRNYVSNGFREEVFWLWGKGKMWYDGGVRSFEDLGEKGFREGFGFFSGEGETCGSDLKM